METCSSCKAPLAVDQRFCVECGSRRSGLPAAVAAVVRSFAAPPPSAPATPPPVTPKSSMFGTWIPSPRSAAVAVLAMLALGVILGSVGQKFAQSAGLAPILVEVPPQESAPPPPEEEVEEEPEEEAAPEEALPEEEVAEEAPEEEAPEEQPPPEEKPELPPEEPPLPPVKHVFVIVLGENSYEEAFGETSTAPYLSEQLPAAGQLLPNYYAVANSGLANQVALLSGQGPTPETAANCPLYSDLAPGTVSAETGQAEGSGCVYPAAVETLADQLVEKELTWKAYIGDIANNPAEPASCRHPPLGAADPRQLPSEGDAYLTWRNPFVYFHSILDGPECAELDVGLDRLSADLEAEETTPTLSYIVPSACQDGGPVPCVPGGPAGPVEAEALLSTIVPQIIASQAYKSGGLIAITSSHAQQAGAAPDTSACCVFPEYPNVPPAPEEKIVDSTRRSGGGGKVGLLLISPYVEPGTVNEAYYNHYSLLRSIEEVLELPTLGYAAEPALTGFDNTVYGLAPTAAEEEWLLPRPALSRRAAEPSASPSR